MSDAPRLKSTNFAAVDGAPIDRVARRVTGEGEQWNPLRSPLLNNEVISATPLPTYELLPATRPSSDFAGRKIGRLFVVGWAGPPGHGKGKRWVVRCDCGNYTYKTTRGLVLGSAADQAGEQQQLKCAHCRYLEYLKNGHVESRCPPELRDEFYGKGRKRRDSWASLAQAHEHERKSHV